jgi:hypothetical protein
MKWDNATVPTMRDPSQLRSTEIGAFEDEIFSMHDPDTTEAAKIQEIMMSSMLQRTLMTSSPSGIIYQMMREVT